MELLKLAVTEGNPFRLIISDVNMPDVDGFMLAQQIRDCAEIHRTPLIMLTSGCRMDDSEKHHELLISASLMKPAKQSELFELITRFMDDSTYEARVDSLIEVPGTMSAGTVGAIKTAKFTESIELASAHESTELISAQLRMLELQLDQISKELDAFLRN